MPDRRRTPTYARPQPVDPLVAAARAIEATRPTTGPLLQYESWQKEAWAYYDCADDQTEILTENGWRRHDEVEVGTRVLTLDHDTGTAGWEPVLDLFKYQVIDEQMLSIEMRHHSSLTTLNHRWPVLRQGYALRSDGNRGTVRAGRTRAWTTSGDLASEDHLITAATVRDVPVTQKYDDAFVELVAWFWTEGTIRRDRKRPQITIGQSDRVNPQNVARIRGVLVSLFGGESDRSWPGRTVGEPRWRQLFNNYNGCWLFSLSVAASESLIAVAPNKVVSHDFLRSLTRAQLHLFLDVSMLADGHSATSMIGQNSRARLEAYEFACVLAGRTPHTTFSEAARMWRLHDLRRQTAAPRRKNRHVIRYTGTVWCPKTPSGTWLARRDGTVYFTGNSLGEFQFGVTWFSNALSRVRLTAAELVPGGDEPEPLDDGPAADLVEQLGGGITGHAAIMKALGVHLAVPGEGWLVAERATPRTPLADTDWTVKSTDEIRPGQSGRGFEIQYDDNRWRPLGEESLPVRIWEPHPRWSWKANSAARAAIPIMRRIDLLDRRIIAMLVSRLAMNGFLLIPQDGTITVPEVYQDQPDPFVAMLIDIASKNIREPGNASAGIPIPIRFQAELIEKWKHLTFGDPIDEQLLVERDKELGRFATTLNMPKEVLTGMGDVNHWGQALLEESAIKTHISPSAETVVGGLTVGYLHPMLEEAGEELTGPNDGKVIVWYDTSELAARPDKSQPAMQAYDRIEISGAALRRESGLDEADAPSKSETREQILKKLVAMPATALQALAQLVGDPSLAPQAPVSGDSPGNPDVRRGPVAPGESSPDTGTPSVQPPTRGTPPPAGTPPPSAAEVAAIAARLLGTDLTPIRVPVAAGLRAPPAANGNGRHSRDGPKTGRR